MANNMDVRVSIKRLDPVTRSRDKYIKTVLSSSFPKLNPLISIDSIMRYPASGVMAMGAENAPARAMLWSSLGGCKSMAEHYSTRPSV